MATQGQKLAAAGTAILVSESALALAHTGGLGVIVGLVLGVAAYASLDDVEQQAGVDLPSLLAPKAKGPGQHSIAYRLLNGKSTRGEQLQEAEPDEQDINMQDSEDEIEDDCLDLGPALRPHVDTVFSNRITILGKPGSGKSNAIADFVEELGRFDAALLVCDSKPEYGPLCEYPYLNKPFRANASTVPLQEAYAFGTWIMRERAQVVLDLPSYKNDTTAAKVMIQILAAMYAWQEALPNDERVPCTIFLDEAHEWLPQNVNQSTVSRAQGKDGEPSILAQLQLAFFSLLKGGRSFGLGCVISTQRPADIDNRAIAFGDWRILLNADLPGDLKVYRAFGVEEGLAQTLAPGQAWVKGPGVKGVYQLRERLSPDESKTPGLEAVQKASPVYKNPGQGNMETPGNSPVYTPVNGSESQLGATAEPPRLRLLETAVNASDEQGMPPGQSVNVNAETRKIIRRMVDEGMKHRVIAKIVGLNGRYYDTYKLVCLEEGIKIEREA